MLLSSHLSKMQDRKRIILHSKKTEGAPVASKMFTGTKACHITTDIQRESLHRTTVDTQKVLLSSLKPDRKY